MGQVSRDESRSGSKAIVPLGAASSKKEEDGCTKLVLYFSSEILPLKEIISLLKISTLPPDLK